MKTNIELSILIILIALISGCQVSPKSTLEFVEVSEGTNMASCISPTRDEVVMDLQGTLFLVSLADGSSRAIIANNYDARMPRFSPDGNEICFQGYAEGNWHIYTIDREGKQLKQITTGIYDHRDAFWSEDGAFLYFSSDSLGSYDIWRFEIQSKLMSKVVGDDFEEFAPTVNKAGDKLAYIQKIGTDHSIVVYSLTEEKILSIYRMTGSIYSPSWIQIEDSSGPQLELLTFSQFLDDKMSLKSFNPLIPDSIIHILSDEDEDVFPFRTSQKGADIYYSSSGTLKSLNLNSRQKSTHNFLAKLAFAKSDYQRKSHDFDLDTQLKIKGIYQAKLAPDAQHIAFIALGDLWIHHMNGSNHRITDDLLLQLNPCWASSDELYYTADETGEISLFKYDLVSKLTSKLTGLSSRPVGMDLSADKNRLAISYTFGPRSGILQILDLNSFEVVFHKQLPYSIGTPSWTGDQNHIITTILQPYSTLYREGVNRAIRISIRDSTVSNIPLASSKSLGARGLDGPSIAPDGKSMLYLTSGKLWQQAVAADGTPLAEPMGLNNELSDFHSWSQDSEHILYMATDRLKLFSLKDQTSKVVDLNLSTKRKTLNQKLVIKNASVLSPDGERFISNQSILIVNNRIEQIASNIDIDEDTEQLDATGKFIIPGLIDIHAHQGSEAGESLGRTWLSWGITSTRDPASNPYDALNRKEGFFEGSIISPRIFFTGSPIDGNRVYYSGTYAQESDQQLDWELDRAEALEYDMIKTYVRLSDKNQKKVIDFAHAMGVPVSSHEIYPAVANGIDGVEHILGTSRRSYTPKMSLTYDSYDDVIQLISRSGMSFTPTIGIYTSYQYQLSKNQAYTSDIRYQTFVPPYQQTSTNIPEDELVKIEKKFKLSANMIKKLADAGALIVAGTDSPILPFGIGLHMELLSYQDAGLSPAQVLRIATLNSAKAIGVGGQLGSLETKKLADILILDKNPLEDIRNLRNMDSVIIDGKLYKIRDLVDKK